MPKLLDEWLNEPDTPLEKQRTVNKAQVENGSLRVDSP
jgi:hypothetical protein